MGLSSRLRITRRMTVVSDVVDPTFSFMTVDWDGQIRMDPSWTYAMQRLIGLKDTFDLSFACDTDHDRHGIITKNDGLLPPNHDLCVAIHYLLSPATPEQKKRLAALSLAQVKQPELAGEKLLTMLTQAPGNDAPIGGLKVLAKSGWFAARPSSTENIYKIYAESFQGEEHSHRILAEARKIVSDVLRVKNVTADLCAPLKPHEMTVSDAEAVWRNEGDPN